MLLVASPGLAQAQEVGAQEGDPPPSEATPSEATPSDSAPTEAAPSEATPSDPPPSEATPSDPPVFSSDRPGFSNTTTVAAVGHLTSELGLAASFDDDQRTLALPNLSLRVGLLDWLEARVLGPSGVLVFADGADARGGAGDPSVGFKIGGRPVEALALSMDWEVSLPLGTDGFGAPEAGFFADLNADWSVWGPLTLTANLVASVSSALDEATGETRRLLEGGGSLAFSWQALDVLGLYVQSYALKQEGGVWRVHLGGGLTWRVAPRVQLDLSADARLTDQGDPPTLGAGTTILW